MGSCLCPFCNSRMALLLVFSEIFPLAGGFNFTPALLASDKPIAIACFVERAPCSPLRIFSISSLTNSPACVDGDLPSRLSFPARSIVFLSGIISWIKIHRVWREEKFPRELHRELNHRAVPDKQFPSPFG